jgi:hypothetical protein
MENCQVLSWAGHQQDKFLDELSGGKDDDLSAVAERPLEP